MLSLLRNLVRTADELSARNAELTARLQENNTFSRNLILNGQQILSYSQHINEGIDKVLREMRERLEESERALYFERRFHEQARMEVNRLQNERVLRPTQILPYRQPISPPSATTIQREPGPNAVAEGQIPDHILFPETHSPNEKDFGGAGENLKAPEMVRTSYVYGNPEGLFPPIGEVGRGNQPYLESNRGRIG